MTDSSRPAVGFMQETQRQISSVQPGTVPELCGDTLTSSFTTFTGRQQTIRVTARVPVTSENLSVYHEEKFFLHSEQRDVRPYAEWFDPICGGSVLSQSSIYNWVVLKERLVLLSRR
ncbi:unnamed protein product [Pleuronectes platessa]|uniref:Uncharacterized protein n=1 Tax=Pleuronectes platessa TaxID=8262 RepID=A0A9N7UUT7_PLEPL|nr:unnamed protein product [Pleuronectes platessa]